MSIYYLKEVEKVDGNNKERLHTLSSHHSKEANIKRCLIFCLGLDLN
jgi:hypothetical protein